MKEFWKKVKLYAGIAVGAVIAFLITVLGLKNRRLEKAEKKIDELEAEKLTIKAEQKAEEIKTEAKTDAVERIAEVKRTEGERIAEAERAENPTEFYNDMVEGFNR